MIEKEDILQSPILEPIRHYDSDGVIIHDVGYEEETKVQEEENPYIETLDALDNIDTLADLIPPVIRKIVKDIVNVLSLDTQGKIIKEIEDGGPAAETPVKEEPGGPVATETPIEEETPERESGPIESISTVPVISTQQPDMIYDAETDIFAKDPGITIKVETPPSLYQLAVSSYKQDDNDLKQEFASRMTDVIQKFYIQMTMISDDAGFPDYSYLLHDFDGSAVTVSHPHSKHLKDVIVRNQVMRNQLERQYQKTHSAEQALVLERAWLAAARRRERYLQEDYK